MNRKTNKLMPVYIDFSVSDTLAEDEEVPDPEKIMKWAGEAFLEKSEVNASFRVVGDVEMQQLNKQFRGKNKPTNVLSFPADLPDQKILGDVALCAGVINNEACEQGKTSEDHWAHMVVHAMLHLQGYDHVKDDEAQEMEALEIKILEKIGVNSPYEY